MKKNILFNDKRHIAPDVLKQKLDYLKGCFLIKQRCADIDFSLETYDTAARIFKLLEPMDVVGYCKKRFGAANDGGYILVVPSDVINTEKANDNKIVYSFGISTYDPFSMDMAELGYQVFQYDGTVDKSPTEHPLIKFYKFNISGLPNPSPTEKNLKQILDDHGHHGKNIILQIDIEDAEWDFFESLSEEEILHFEQISVEFHCFFMTEPEHIKRRMKVLEKINKTHQVVHLHANNHGKVCIIDGLYFLPQSFEVTYLRKTNPVTKKQEYKFKKCFNEFPIEGLDAPCCADYPDIYIGHFNLTDKHEEMINFSDKVITRFIFELQFFETYFLLEKNKQLEKKHSQLVSEINQLHKENKQLIEKSNRNIHSRIDEEGKILHERINSLHEENKGLHEENKGLHGEINSLHREIDSLHDEIDKKTSLRYFAGNIKRFIQKKLLKE